MKLKKVVLDLDSDDVLKAETPQEKLDMAVNLLLGLAIRTFTQLQQEPTTFQGVEVKVAKLFLTATNGLADRLAVIVQQVMAEKKAKLEELKSERVEQLVYSGHPCPDCGLKHAIGVPHGLDVATMPDTVAKEILGNLSKGDD